MAQLKYHTELRCGTWLAIMLAITAIASTQPGHGPGFQSVGKRFGSPMDIPSL